MNIEWKDIAGYEGLYQVSNTGRIRRLRASTVYPALYVLTLKFCGKGKYSCVILCADNVKKHWLVHRLVALAFLGPPPFLGAVINHLNGIRQDNRPENLEWTTHTGNALHAFANGLKIPTNVAGERNPRAKLTVSDVKAILSLKGIEGSRKLANRYRVSRSTIQFIHQGKRWAQCSSCGRICG